MYVAYRSRVNEIAPRKGKPNEDSVMDIFATDWGLWYRCLSSWSHELFDFVFTKVSSKRASKEAVSRVTTKAIPAVPVTPGGSSRR